MTGTPEQATQPSYAHGPSDVPLLGDTHRRRAPPRGRAVRRPRRARGPLAGLPRDLPPALGRDHRGGAGPASRWGSRAAIASACGRRTASSGWCSSTRQRGSARSSSTSTRPTRRPSPVRAAAVGHERPACWRARSARPTTSRSWPRCAIAALPSGTRWSSRTTGPRCSPAARRSRRRSSAAREAALQFDDPINIQYTSGTTGFPKGATLSHHNVLNNGFFIARTLRYTEADRVCVPVPFYHCFGMVIGNLAAPQRRARASSCRARRSSRWLVLETVAAERCTSLYGVPMMFIAELDHPRLRGVRSVDACAPGVMAGAACPIEVMRAGADAHGHARGDDLLRHDGDLAGVHAERHRRSAREAGLDGGPGPPARRGQDRRSGDGRDRAARRPGRAVHARLQRDAGLLGRRGGDPRRDRSRRAGCTPAIWPRWTPRATSTSSAASRT